jgi:hypothetical protein
MPDFLTTLDLDSHPDNALVVLLRLLVALLLGICVALLYRRTRSPEDITPTFPMTLVLLAVLIAMVTQVIGDNVARAFSLVGALSIVRFRTVVRDTQDTAYVIFAVVTGMAVGAHNLSVAIIGLLVVAAAALYEWMGSRKTEEPIYLLTLKLSLGVKLESLTSHSLTPFTQGCHLVSLGTCRQGAGMEYLYTLRLKRGQSPTDLLRTLNHIDGVQEVQLRRRSFLE